MAKEIKLTKGTARDFSAEESAALALELPEVRPRGYANAFVLFWGAFLLAILIYSAFTTVPIVVEGEGVVAFENQPVPVRASYPLTIESVNVSNQKPVRKDEILIVSTDALKALESLRVQAVIKGLRELTTQNSFANCANCLNLVTSVLNQVQQLPPGSRILDLFKPLMEPLEQARELLSQQLTNPTSPTNQLNASALESIKSKILSAQRDLEAMVFNINKSAMITAPINGQVTNLRNLNPGDAVDRGQILLEITPEDNRLLATADILNKDIGSIAVGEPVEVTFDAFPEMDYGFIKGKVEEILSPESGQHDPAAKGFKTFKIRVSLSQQHFQRGGETHKLLPGMIARTRTVKRHETLLKSAYRTLFRLKDEIKVRQK